MQLGPTVWASGRNLHLRPLQGVRLMLAKLAPPPPEMIVLRNSLMAGTVNQGTKTDHSGFPPLAIPLLAFSG